MILATKKNCRLGWKWRVSTSASFKAYWWMEMSTMEKNINLSWNWLTIEDTMGKYPWRLKRLGKWKKYFFTHQLFLSIKQITICMCLALGNWSQARASNKSNSLRRTILSLIRVNIRFLILGVVKKIHLIATNLELMNMVTMIFLCQAIPQGTISESRTIFIVLTLRLTFIHMSLKQNLNMYLSIKQQYSLSFDRKM